MLPKTIPPCLRGIPNIGPATALDLQRLGYERLEDLRGEDADRLYDRLCRTDGVQHDICVRDVFAALIDQANGRRPRPWWHYSRRRLAANGRRQGSKPRRT